MKKSKRKVENVVPTERRDLKNQKEKEGNQYRREGMKQKEENTKDKKCCRERRGLKEYKQTKINNKEERHKKVK